MPASRKSDRVRQGHVAVVAADKYRRVRGQRIDQFLGRHGGGRPFGFIPVAADDPFALGCLLGLFANAAGKFRGAGGVVQLHAVERQAAVDEMHVRVVEAGQQ